MFEKDHGIIIACDVDDLEQLKILVENTYGINGIVGYKIGANLALQYGLKNIVKEITFNLPVIYDHQKAGTDIPFIGEKFARACKIGGMDSVIIFPQAGPKTESAFIDAIIRHDMVPMVGGEMTHEQYLAEDGGYLQDNAPYRMYELAAKKSIEYFIVPGNKVEAIKKHHLLLTNLINEPKYCMPGIGTQGGSITAAFSVLRGYSAYAIIGSAIYTSKNIHETAKRFADEANEFD